MKVRDLIDSYVFDVARHLPRKQRDDVMVELRALLADELEAKAGPGDVTPDAETTLAYLRAFGRPRDVAARYQLPVAIIDPADTRSFLTAAAVGGVLVVALRVALMPFDESVVQLSLLAWIGALAVFFGIKGWVHRCSSENTRWMPSDPDRVSRAGMAALAAVALCGIVVSGAPGWVAGLLPGGPVLPVWLRYDDHFASSRLPWLLTVGTMQAALFVALGLKGRWQPRTRGIDIALELALVGLLAWFIRDDVMLVTESDAVAKAILATALVFVLLDTAVKVYRSNGSIELPRAIGTVTH
jgi:hypothetical protein